MAHVSYRDRIPTVPAEATVAVMRGLRGKNVLVTGGTSGIGQAIAVRFASQGDESSSDGAALV
jgi:FlaA1/EpsC-like NDP-sugar epimerase